MQNTQRDIGKPVPPPPKKKFVAYNHYINANKIMMMDYFHLYLLF